MREKIIQKAKALHISEIGFAPARIYDELENILNQRGEVPFVCEPPRSRVDPFLIMPEVKSIIVFLCSYHNGREGILSEYAMGKDYHRVLSQKGEELCAFLGEAGWRGMSFSDNGPLNDRYLAYLAGLGFFGKNGFLIHPKWGTYTVIGYILTDCPLKPDAPMQQRCTGCGQCIRACPGHALGEGMRYDSEKCASYITQKKGELTEEEIQLIQKTGSAWGCDICQRVCPHNINAALTQIPEFKENLVEQLSIREDMSNREFKKYYGNRAFSWRGKRILERNLKILREMKQDK